MEFCRCHFIAIETNEDVELFKEKQVSYIEIIKHRLKLVCENFDPSKKITIKEFNEIKRYNNR